MRFPSPLLPGTLVRRYKRFFADVALADGSEITAHCPNPGAMLGLNAPGLEAWVSTSEDPKRKLRHTLELVRADGALVGINTGHPNRIVAEALAARALPSLSAYGTVRREVAYGERSRVDFLLEGEGLPPCWLEVKNVHLARRPPLAEFPDCVTDRGARHLAELAGRVRAGERAVMLYLVQREDCTRFALARDLDPAYAAAFAQAEAAGVESLCISCSVTLQGITLGSVLPIVLADTAR